MPQSVWETHYCHYSAIHLLLTSSQNLVDPLTENYVKVGATVLSKASITHTRANVPLYIRTENDRTYSND